MLRLQINARAESLIPKLKGIPPSKKFRVRPSGECSSKNVRVADLCKPIKPILMA
jgi:hypothetical protein